MSSATGGLKTRGLVCLALASAIVACGGTAQRASSEERAIPALDETIANLSPAERDELQRSMATPSGYDGETLALRDAFFHWVAERDARDAQQRAMDIPSAYDPETRAAREAYFRWLSDHGK